MGGDAAILITGSAPLGEYSPYSGTLHFKLFAGRFVFVSIQTHLVGQDDAAFSLANDNFHSSMVYILSVLGQDLCALIASYRNH